ncbi:telomere length regulation protein TEL2 homolog isoform X1 [Nasonia vitripennis]|uniref:ENTH domain-containing protein n=2 Tax=Nasonia vitripennis TaxID=7425 RepID=A0A7M7QDG5_NASVI|nr:telomere length regulation protein TEL2 homolog isoform X1 [Nasonia vitripennis]
MMNMWKVRELMDKATNVVMNYTDTEAKVREATNDDAWGPTGAMMQELAQATFTYEQFPEVMSMLWKRMLQENKRNWRRTYKSLLLLNYLVRNGSERVVTSSREHIYDLRSLENYSFIDEFGKDQGINIRHKVRELIDFIQDDDKLREERKKAKKNKDKYIGMSSEAMGMRLGGGGGGGDRWMDNPKWASNKSSGGGGDGYNDWDRGDNRSRGFEDANNSDDGEREDSDNETHTSPRKNPGTGERREYRDTMESVDRVPKPVTTPATNTTSPVRAPRTIKKVDLGAAANYGKDQPNLMTSPVKQPPQRSRNEILNDIFDSQNDNNGTVTKTDNDDDDFNPRADNYAPLSTSQNVSSGDFGDFTSAFGSPPTSKQQESGGDEFADFTSAFDSGLSISQQPPQPQQPQISLIGATIPNIGNPMADNLMAPIGTQVNTGFGAGNDLFNTMQSQTLVNQPQTINNSNNNTSELRSMSNTDLLSDLAGFNAPLAPTNNLNNANLFNSDTSPFNNTASSGKIKERHTYEKLANQHLLEILQTVSSSKSQNSLKQLRGRILEYSKFLPGPLTPQKFIGLDISYELDVILYSRVLENLVHIFDPNWPLMEGQLDQSIRDVFIVDGANCQILNESLLILTQELKVTEDFSVMKCFAVFLEELIKSDAILSAMVISSRATGVSDFERSTEHEIWQRIIQIVISLPNRVANRMQRSLLDTFKLKNFTSILSFHVTRAIYFLNEATYQNKTEVDTKIISMLLSKMFLILSRDDLRPLVDIIVEWCISKVNNIQLLIHKILLEIDSHGNENLAIMFMKHLKFTPDILGNLVINENWRHALITRIPLMSWYNDDRILKNFVSYLFCTQTSNDRILVNLVINLLDVWGDQSALNHTTFDQHLYITKLIILSVKCMKGRIIPSERDQILKLVFSGIPTHLGSTDVAIRGIGMITGETLTSLLIHDSEVEKLKFEYDGMGKNILILIETLKNLKNESPGEKMEESEVLTLGEIEFENIGDKKLFELGVECKILKNISFTVSQEFVRNPDVNQSIISQKSTNTTSQILPAQLEEELDSDDDLVPYDLSNDIKSSEKLKPLYLRDIRDNLVHTESKDPEKSTEIFEETLKVSEELILMQLQNDDPSFACELLEIFLSLQERSSVENFEVLVFKACIAIVTVHPKQTAEYICKQFHSELSKYSVQDRLLMLNVLCEAANRLSAVEISKADIATKEVAIPAKKKKLSKPVSLFIETDKSKKYETLYEDDFDDSIEEASLGVDWHEVVQRRISTKTRHFAHSTKLPSTTVNKFGNVVDSFFYPLIHGFGNARHSFMYELPRSYHDQECILLTRFLETLASIMTNAQNCTAAPRMAKEILELAWVLRYHDNAKVRLAVVKCVAAVLVSVPEFELKGNLLSALMEIRMWLIDLTQNTFKGDPDRDCKELGRHVLYLVGSVVQGMI